MQAHLKRHYGYGHSHFITCSCYRRQPLFTPHERKDLFLVILEQVRKRYQGSIFGYVVMPEHIHLLLSEPKRKDLSTFMQVLKQRVTDRVYPRSRRPGLSRQAELRPSVTPGPRHFWQPRFHDFNVFTRYKFIQKLRYIHRNPVARGLIESPEQWRWSSYRFYAYGEKGPVTLGYDLSQSMPEKKTD